MKLNAGEIVTSWPIWLRQNYIIKDCSGIEKIQKGEIRLNNQTISSQNTHLSPDKRGVGYVFQDCALFPHLTILDNIFFGLDKKEIQFQTKKIQKLLNEINLSIFLKNILMNYLAVNNNKLP